MLEGYEAMRLPGPYRLDPFVSHHKSWFETVYLLW